MKKNVQDWIKLDNQNKNIKQKDGYYSDLILVHFSYNIEMTGILIKAKFSADTVQCWGQKRPGNCWG